MKSQFPRLDVLYIVFASVIATANSAYSQGTGFTYQGSLRHGGAPESGVFDFLFAVYDAAVSGTRVAGPTTNFSVGVANGLFTTTVDFGEHVFTGGERWLEISVRTNGNGTLTTLLPRQALTATPYAVYAGGANAGGIVGTIPSGVIGNGTITSNHLGIGAAAANLAASGQSPVPAGALLLSSESNATNLIATGYVRMGGQVDLCWQQNESGSSPSARGSHTAVWTGSRMVAWGGTDAKLQPLNTGGSYDPSAGNWLAMVTSNAPSARSWHTAIWSGSEMIVWGGIGGGRLSDGGRYDPSVRRWSLITSSNAPTARSSHTAVWTGSEMIVWGGVGSDDVFLNTGARYKPANGSWSRMTTTNAPTARILHTAVWTGSEMIVWGGALGANVQSNEGARYNPVTDTWSPTSTSAAPDARAYHQAVWTGSEMIIWGGQSSRLLGSGNVVTTFLGDGARYNPSTDTWSAIATNSAPKARYAPTAVWTGSEMIVWGGSGDGAYLNTGGRYDPTTDHWIPVSTGNAPGPRQGHAVIWTGSEMLLFGGYNNDTTFGDTHAYTPARTMYMYLRP